MLLLRQLLLLGALLPSLLEAVEIACDSDQEPITVMLLLPLSGENSAFGQSMLDGFVAGDDEPLTSACPVNLRYLDTEEETTTFIEQWYRALETEPDLLVGPLLAEHQEQLNGLGAVELPPATRWLYSGETSLLTTAQREQIFTLSLGWRESLRNLLEFGWDQGQHDLALLLPDSDLGRLLAETATVDWEERGGVVRSTVHYGKRFSALNQALRQLLRESGEQFDFLITLVDEQRLRMLRPLMNYHSREEAIYSLTPPIGTQGLKKDLEEILYPMQPALLERGYRDFEVDDFLLQIEGVGFDLMMMLRSGTMYRPQQQQRKKRPLIVMEASYLGRGGRYAMEEGHLLRTLCIARHERGRMVPEYCPTAEENRALLE